MGRPPIGQRAMSSAERQRRFLARIRQQAATPPAPAPTSKPPPSVTADGATIRVTHLAMDPIRTALWIHQKLGERGRPFANALAQAYANPTITSEHDE